jgi:hypothetical protein
MLVDSGDQAHRGEIDRGLDRTIVLVGTIGATVFLVIVLAVLAASGDRKIVADTITPLLVSVSGFIMLRFGKPNAAAHLLIGMLGIALCCFRWPRRTRARPRRWPEAIRSLRFD